MGWWPTPTPPATAIREQASVIPLCEPYLDGREMPYILECVESTWVSSNGEYIDRFERAIAQAAGVTHAVACVSGTAALHISLLLSGIRPDDEVLVPTVTFIAPINAVRYAGAWPVFFDCDEFASVDIAAMERFLRGECVRRDGVTVNKATGRRVSGIVPVHVFGTPVDMDRVLDLAAEFDLAVVEDAAEALGSSYKQRLCGGLAPIAAMSFNGNKIVTSGGGGAILTDDGDVARRARHLTTQAKEPGVEYIHDEVGFNYRMNNLLAALGLAQIETLAERLAAKRRNFTRYEELVGTDRLIQQPSWSDSNRWFYAYLCDDAEDKQRILDACAEAGIQVRPLWYPNHLQKPYRQLQSYEISRATDYYDRVVNLPCSVTLTDEQVQRVVEVIQPAP